MSGPSKFSQLQHTIRKLEERLGVRLLTRTSRSVATTKPGHRCINLLHQAKGGVSVWDLEKDGRAVNVRVDGQLVVNDIAIVRQGATGGLGLCYLPKDYLQSHLDSGELVQVLEDWCPPFPGYHLYYPSRR